jgi:hypothetical protein
MPSSRRNDDRPIRRRAPFRESKYRILVVCEGEKTEPLYFRGLRHHVRNPRLHVEPVGPAGVPRSVVEAAIRLRNEARETARRERDDNHLWDEVWAVFDVDDHPHLSEARDLARANSVALAISNPCFELWALLHFTEQRSSIERHRVREELKRYLPRYEKELEFSKVHVGYSDAVRRATELDDEAGRHGSPDRNPTTGVYRLTEIIRTK